MRRPQCYGCDTFVAVGSASGYPDRATVFGKNSDRPASERQVLRHYARQAYPDDYARQCTYVTVRHRPSGSELADGGQTLEVAVCQPAWMWGAESGVNECGVAVGNEAVWTREPTDASPTALTGMDLVRLALERGRSARAAAEVIIRLLERYGQGGACSEPTGQDGADGGDAAWTYHNSFLVADPTEAWVLDTAGKYWALEHVRDGVRSLSNRLSVGRPGVAADGAAEHAREMGWWDGTGAFDFARAFSAPGTRAPTERELRGAQLMRAGVQREQRVTAAYLMRRVLRDRVSGICMGEPSSCCGSTDGDAFATTASHVSVLSRDADRRLHFFTGTPLPHMSMFKPFFLAREGGDRNGLDGRIADYLARGIFERRRAAVRHARIDFDKTAVPVLHSTPQQRQACHMPGELGERLAFLETLCAEQAMALCGLPPAFRKAEHELLRESIAEALQRHGKQYLRMETKMLFPCPLPECEWEAYFQRYAGDHKSTLFEKALMREEYEYELFGRDAGVVDARRRIRGVQLAQKTGESFNFPLPEQTQERKDEVVEHVYHYT